MEEPQTDCEIKCINAWTSFISRRTGNYYYLTNFLTTAGHRNKVSSQ